MTDFWFYVTLGFDHVMDLGGYDHMLFLAVLVAGYAFAEWKQVLTLVTVFTLGHMASLTLATFIGFSYPQDWVEFLIPVTIFLTALHKGYHEFKKSEKANFKFLVLGTLFFGLIHGLGFASFFGMMEDSQALALFEFALGIEAAQVLIVFLVIAIGSLLMRVFGLARKWWVYLLCIATLVIVVPMLIETWPL